SGGAPGAPPRPPPPGGATRGAGPPHPGDPAAPEPQTLPRQVVERTARLSQERLLDGGKRVRGREQFRDVRLAQVQGHQESLVRLLDEAELAVPLEHGPLDLVERADLVEPRRFGQLLDGQALPPQVALDRLALERAAREREPEHDPGRRNLENRARPG